LIELLKPLGPEQARRWIALLAVVPEDERVGLIESVEKRIAEVYGGADTE